jgi:type IV pilus assembly protein PilC
MAEVKKAKLKGQKEIKEITFIWEGKDKKGKQQRGEMRAVSDSVVKVALRSKGILVSKIKKQRFAKSKPIKQGDVAVFTRQLATMMKSGVPLLQSFEIVANGHSNPSVAKLLYDIKNEVEQGSSMAQAFSKHPKYFDDLFCNLVEAGEKAGILDMILDRLALYQEKIQNIKSKTAMFYPIAVMGVATVVTAILMIFVVPSFKTVFESFGAELPGPTQVVMNISDFMVANWYFIFGGFAVGLAAFKHALKTNIKVRHGFERTLLKLPIMGVILHKSAVARWARTLATMFAAGVPLVEALGSVAGAAGNIVYYTATKNIQREVETGQSLTISMQEQNIFPNMMIQMAQIGEESGSLDDMLNKVAEFYEGEVDDAVASMSSLIEPLIISFLGVVVGGLVVAMYLPIFKMAGTV